MVDYDRRTDERGGQNLREKEVERKNNFLEIVVLFKMKHE